MLACIVLLCALRVWVWAAMFRAVGAECLWCGCGGASADVALGCCLARRCV